jgi:hypothetical protein
MTKIGVCSKSNNVVIKSMTLWLTMTWMCLGIATGNTTATTLPWFDQERLSYDITCGPIMLGELVLTSQKAEDKKDLWEFKAQLVSTKLLNHVIPVDQVKSTLLSVCEIDPWRSWVYLQDRNEGKNVVQKIREMNYTAHEGTIYEGPMRGSKRIEKYPLQEASVEDPVSLLYRIRKDVQQGNEILSYTIIENKKRINLKGEITRLSGATKETKVLIREASDNETKKTPKYLELKLRTDDGYIPSEAKLAWGPFSIKIKLDVEKTKNSNLIDNKNKRTIRESETFANKAKDSTDNRAQEYKEGLTGRFIRVQLVGVGRLRIPPVKVFDQLKAESTKDISLGGKIKVSSEEKNVNLKYSPESYTYPKRISELETTKYTCYEISPWWEVDLGKDMVIQEIRYADDKTEKQASAGLLQISINKGDIIREKEKSSPSRSNLYLAYFFCGILITIYILSAINLIQGEHLWGKSSSIDKETDKTYDPRLVK